MWGGLTERERRTAAAPADRELLAAPAGHRAPSRPGRPRGIRSPAQGGGRQADRLGPPEGHRPAPDAACRSRSSCHSWPVQAEATGRRKGHGAHCHACPRTASLHAPCTLGMLPCLRGWSHQGQPRPARTPSSPSVSFIGPTPNQARSRPPGVRVKRSRPSRAWCGRAPSFLAGHHPLGLGISLLLRWWHGAGALNRRCTAGTRRTPLRSVPTGLSSATTAPIRWAGAASRPFGYGRER